MAASRAFDRLSLGRLDERLAARRASHLSSASPEIYHHSGQPMNFPLRKVLRLVLGLTFSIAGAMKLIDPPGFFSDLLSYRVPFPEIFWRIEAASLPWLELLTGMGLILNFWPETLRPVTCLLSLIFILMLGQALIRGLHLDCGCFGAHSGGWFERLDVALGRATLLFAASLYVAAEPAAQSPPTGA